jgi:hypothetical protein
VLCDAAYLKVSKLVNPSWNACDLVRAEVELLNGRHVFEHVWECVEPIATKIEELTVAQ